MGLTRAIIGKFYNLIREGPSAPEMVGVPVSGEASSARKTASEPISKIDPEKDIDWIGVRKLAIGILVMDGRSEADAKTVLRRLSGDPGVAKRLYDAARRGDRELELAQRLVRTAY